MKTTAICLLVAGTGLLVLGLWVVHKSASPLVHIAEGMLHYSEVTTERGSGGRAVIDYQIRCRFQPAPIRIGKDVRVDVTLSPETVTVNEKPVNLRNLPPWWKGLQAILLMDGVATYSQPVHEKGMLEWTVQPSSSTATFDITFSGREGADRDIGTCTDRNVELGSTTREKLSTAKGWMLTLLGALVNVGSIFVIVWDTVRGRKKDKV